MAPNTFISASLLLQFFFVFLSTEDKGQNVKLLVRLCELIASLVLIFTQLKENRKYVSLHNRNQNKLILLNIS